jgi:DNA polymerase-3 subunit alpha
VDKNKLIYPLSNIKSIGIVVSEQIKKAKENGPFIDIFDCFSRLYIAGVKKSTFEVLIYADVFKEFRLNRKTLITNLDSLYNYAELTKDIDPSLVMKPELEIVREYDKIFLLEKEKEVFGFYLSSHPTTLYRKDEKYCIFINEIEKYYDKTIDVLLLVEKLKEIATKKGDKMAFITGSDETGSMEFIMFPKTYLGNDNISKGNIVKVRGRVEKRLNEIQVIVDKIKIIQGVKNEE